MEQRVVPPEACASACLEIRTVADEVLALTPDPDAGRRVFSANCTFCHDADGTGVDGLGADLTDETDLAYVVDRVLFGTPEGMTPFVERLELQPIRDVGAFVLDL